MADEFDGPVAHAARRAWERVLKVDDTSPEDDFFELGGHSLSAMRIIAMVRHDLVVDVGMKVLLMNPRFADFVRGITEHMGSASAISADRAVCDS